MPATTSAYDIEIDATDGAAAIDLEIRLAHLTPTTIGRGNDWIVEIPGPANVEAIEAVVREWLDDLGQPATTIRADGRMLRIEGHHARKPHRAPNRNFIG
ncbi:MAG TPA: hypothetical protein VIL77_07105 [Gaiellaceae bacterium]